jgi:hypothetical protein
MIGRVRDTQPKQAETDDLPNYRSVSEITNLVRVQASHGSATPIPAAWVRYHPV